MALSDSQKSKIRRFLGYSDLIKGYYHVLEGAMNAIGTEGQTEVEAILADLATVEAQIRTAWTRLKVTKAEDVTLDAKGEIRMLWKEGNRLASNLGIMFGVAPASAYFSSTNSSGVARRG